MSLMNNTKNKDYSLGAKWSVGICGAFWLSATAFGMTVSGTKIEDVPKIIKTAAADVDHSLRGLVNNNLS